MITFIINKDNLIIINFVTYVRYKNFVRIKEKLKL